MCVLRLQPEPDGCGFFYGTFEIGDAHYRVDVLPPIGWRYLSPVVRSTAADPTRWIVFVDGDEVARVTSRDDVEATLRTQLVE